MNKPDIRELSSEELALFLSESGQKPFRKKQLENWLWKHFVFSFDDMGNLPQQLIEKMKESYSLTVCDVHALTESSDGTLKMAFGFADGLMAEGVLIPSDDRLTACLSTQIGCAVKCTFCATGTMGFKRHLTAPEMYAHFVRLNNVSIEKFGKPLTNAVIMGMGEPLLNYENTMRFIDLLSGTDGLNFSPRRITLSTVGIPDEIVRLTDAGARFNLALSLHACTDELRQKLVPVAAKHRLYDIIKALQYYYAATKNIVTFEYVLLSGINDTPVDALKLATLCKKIPSKVNLIPFNTFPGTSYTCSSDKAIESFARLLESQGVNCLLRRSRGGNIGAACGQLAIKMTGKK